MKNKALLGIYLLAALVIAVDLFFNVRDSMRFSMDDLPAGQELYAARSPDGAHTLTVYRVDNTLGIAVRADVRSGGSVRNIYWQTGLDDVDYSWLDNENVMINDVVINVEEGSYDCRRGYSIFSEGSLEGRELEQNSRKD